MVNVLLAVLVVFLLWVLVMAVILCRRDFRGAFTGKVAGAVTWDELNLLYYEKFPNLRQIECESCSQQYRDFDQCPQCGHSRWVQLGVEPPSHQCGQR